ncbi:Biogenesis of lysosome-related organelles complex 1 subunit 4 [Acipenser ruthenus]|uniref:Biogenesis of lysosome-related organelles complex 1 subunit 4 n=1 Tax=Acipenser ruthenus TaxID=7906 RepID=A0A662YYR8_ACIRT|nr:biogenesis of lysosome-related organelles complex 1 subunit 4-like isoform X2 [Acipenser ruthenus]RXN01187.1 Biogenesis of lysosome-related organelles complex 1 subunit 4 [Acipenser ruthenus]
MEQRLDEEELATDVSRDSGNVSQSESSGSVISEGLSSGNISHSHSFSAAVPQGDGDPDRLLERTAKSYSSYLKANVGEDVESLEKSLEEMLTRVDEFVGMLDMAFVKMVGHNVTVMEEQVTQAESDLGTFPSAFKKIFRTIAVPAFLNKTTSRQQPQQEPPPVFRTEDYFSSHSGQ